MLGSRGHFFDFEVSITLMRKGILNRVVVFADFSGKKVATIPDFRTGLPLECRELADLPLMPWQVGREIRHQTVR